MNGPLGGVRVLDLTWMLAGPYATMVLADMGAEVIKVEQPGKGDFARQNPPFIGDQSAYFLSINRGKKSIVLNLKDEEDRARFLALVEEADVVIENFRPGTMERLQLGYETLRARNPALIYASCSGFGSNSPYAAHGAYDIIIQAMAGTTSINGEPKGGPTRVGFSVGDIGGGLFTALAILAALLERERSGEGQAIEISLFDAQVALLENAFARYFATGEIARQLGSRHPAIATFGLFETADSYIAVAAATEAQWKAMCTCIGLFELTTDPRFASNAARSQNRGALDELILPALRQRTTAEWMKLFTGADVPAGPVLNVEEVVESDQFEASGMRVEVEHPRLGRLVVLGSPMRFSRTPVVIKTAAPELGADTDEVLARLQAVSTHKEV